MPITAKPISPSRAAELVTEAQKLVAKVNADVAEGATCASWLLDDEAACNAQKALVRQLAAKVDKMAAGAVDASRDAHAAGVFLDDSAIVAQLARSTSRDAEAISYTRLVEACAHDFGHVVETGARFTGNTARALVNGLIAGLGPELSLALLVGFALYATRGDGAAGSA